MADERKVTLRGMATAMLVGVVLTQSVVNYMQQSSTQKMQQSVEHIMEIARLQRQRMDAHEAWLGSLTTTLVRQLTQGQQPTAEPGSGRIWFDQNGQGYAWTGTTWGPVDLNRSWRGEVVRFNSESGTSVLEHRDAQGQWHAVQSRPDCHPQMQGEQVVAQGSAGTHETGVTLTWTNPSIIHRGRNSEGTVAYHNNFVVSRPAVLRLGPGSNEGCTQADGCPDGQGIVDSVHWESGQIHDGTISTSDVITLQEATTTITFDPQGGSR